MKACNVKVAESAAEAGLVILMPLPQLWNGKQKNKSMKVHFIFHLSVLWIYEYIKGLENNIILICA